MRICSGRRRRGVGGDFGAALAHAGADVTFIRARRASRGDAQRGVEGSRGGRGETHLVPTEADRRSGQGVGPVDVVLFCVELARTSKRGRAHPADGRSRAPPVIPLQKRHRCARTAALDPRTQGGDGRRRPDRRLLIIKPGVINQVGTFMRSDLGELDGSINARAARRCDCALPEGRLRRDHERTDRHRRLDEVCARWRQCRHDRGVTRLADRQAARRSRSAAAVRLRLREETIAVARAEGIKALPPDAPGRRCSTSSGMRRRR